MTERTDTPSRRLDIEPVEVPAPEAVGDGTGQPLPPLPDDAYPPGAVPVPVDTGDTP